MGSSLLRISAWFDRSPPGRERTFRDTAKNFRAFRVSGLPTTFLIDRDGGIVGAYVGPADWDGPEARALIEYYLNRPASAQGHAATVTKIGG